MTTSFFRGLHAVVPRRAAVASRSLRLALLCVALALVAISAYQPHWRPDEGRYRYPVHLDEYWHWGMATAVQRTGVAEAPDPFTGASARTDAEGLRYPTQIHERGFHAYFATFQSATGLDWIVIFEVLPSVIAVLTGLAIFVLAERWGGGAEAALWYAAVPTTLRFLGPGFLVPISLALFIVVVGFFVATDRRSRSAWGAALILSAGVWPIHAMGALLLTALIGLYLTFVGVSARSAALLAAIALPFALAWPHYAGDLSATVLRESTLPAGLEVLRAVGPAVYVAAAIGAGTLVAARPRQTRAAGAALAIVVIAGLVLVWARATAEADPFRLYDRTVSVLLPLLAILGGAGTAALVAGSTKRTARNLPRAATLAIVVAILAAQGSAVVQAGNASEATYYHPLTTGRYDAMSAFAESPHWPRAAVVDGLDTMAWTALTGGSTLYVKSPLAGRPPAAIEAFFASGARDTEYLVTNDITVVVTDRPVANPDLVHAGGAIYVLRPEIAARMSAN